MNKPMIPALGAALAALAACGQQSGPANEVGADANGQALPEANATIDDAAAGNAQALDQGPPIAAPAPPAEPKVKIAPVPKTKIAPRSPPPANDDPHAGHDMSNMANEQ